MRNVTHELMFAFTPFSPSNRPSMKQHYNQQANVFDVTCMCNANVHSANKQTNNTPNRLMHASLRRCRRHRRQQLCRSERRPSLQCHDYHRDRKQIMIRYNSSSSITHHPACAFCVPASSDAARCAASADAHRALPCPSVRSFRFVDIRGGQVVRFSETFANIILQQIANLKQFDPSLGVGATDIQSKRKRKRNDTNST